MEESAWWPKCVSSCPMRLPDIASETEQDTGLEPVIPPNTIAAGQFGHYICKNRDMGVNKGKSNLLPVSLQGCRGLPVPL